MPRRLIQHLQWGAPLPEPPTATSVGARQARAEALLARVAAAAGVRILSVADRMCATECVVWDNNRLLYYDDDHLSGYGAIKMIAPLLAPVLAGPLPKSEPGEAQSPVPPE